MPELPDIQVVSEVLDARLTGKKITDMTFYRTNRVKPSKDAVSQAAIGSAIARVGRNGKALIFQLDSGPILQIHLMLKGRIKLGGSLEKNCVATLSFGEDKFQISDPTSWATLELLYASKDYETVPDPMDPKTFTIEYFRKSLDRKKNKSIKSFLIDQSIITGIGNAYADEILAEAGVHPASICGIIPAGVRQELFEAVGSVLANAIKCLREIPDPDRIIDARDFFKVHIKGRTVTDEGFEIKNLKIDGKSSYFHEGQILFQ